MDCSGRCEAGVGLSYRSVVVVVVVGSSVVAVFVLRHHVGVGVKYCVMSHFVAAHGVV